jgi:tRNA-specific 2-thiouridylase
VIHDDRMDIMFDRPQRALTPGQSVVLYRDQVCLGGGIIEAAMPTDH